MLILGVGLTVLPSNCGSHTATIGKVGDVAIVAEVDTQTLSPLRPLNGALKLLTSKANSSHHPPGRTRGKTSMKRGFELQLHKSTAAKLILGMAGRRIKLSGNEFQP